MLTGRHIGLTDLAPTPHGEHQSRGLGLRLQSIGIARVPVSPRLRAQQTCDLARLGMASEVEPDLTEWDYGDFEGRRSLDVLP
jgi:broad specificity phosphatase PhoE